MPARPAQPDAVVDQLEVLLRGYCTEMRAITQPYRLQAARAADPNLAFDPTSDLIRENLLEHVGSLPVVAAALYPYLENPEVDLGRTLSILAIHDIGEPVTGDEITFTKTGATDEAEAVAAKSLIDPSLHELYDEYRAVATPSAKFAKAVDKITPDIFDYLTPADITIARYRHFLDISRDEIVPLIIQHKRPYMKWNPFMHDLHVRLLDRLSDKLTDKIAA